MSGIYGSAWRDGQLLSEVVTVTATIEIAQIDVPLAGQTKMGHKTGRETRTGTLRYQKIDTRWEMEVYDFLAQTLTARRKARDQGKGQGLKQFRLLLDMDDPDALGIEKWQLDGCQIYRLSLGFDSGTDITEQEIPITWESEKPIYAFTKGVGPGGNPIPHWFPGLKPAA
jgi:hypothetical protein